MGLGWVPPSWIVETVRSVPTFFRGWQLPTQYHSRPFPWRQYEIVALLTSAKSSNRVTRRTAVRIYPYPTSTKPRIDLVETPQGLPSLSFSPSSSPPHLLLTLSLPPVLLHSLVCSLGNSVSHSSTTLAPMQSVSSGPITL